MATPAEIPSSAANFRRHLITALKFIFLAVPGGFLLVIGLLMTFAAASSRPYPNRATDLIAFPLAAVLGIPMTSYGLGRWNQWRYIYVFLSMPASLLALGLLHIRLIDPKLDVIFTIVPPLVIYRIVKKSYGATTERHLHAP